jgi:hypothetical protein
MTTGMEQPWPASSRRSGTTTAAWPARAGAARCFPVKVLGAGGTGHSADVGAGIIWAVDQRARVINVSLGTSRGTVALSRAVAYAKKHDVVVVAAAGNAGATAPFFPAAYDGVIAMAASDPADRIYEWSNRGDWVAVAAPGCNLTLDVEAATETSAAPRRPLRWSQGSWPSCAPPARPPRQPKRNGSWRGPWRGSGLPSSADVWMPPSRFRPDRRRARMLLPGPQRDASYSAERGTCAARSSAAYWRWPLGERARERLTCGDAMTTTLFLRGRPTPTGRAAAVRA